MEGKKSILAIDDNTTQLKIFQTMLSEHYELALVKSAAEARSVMGARTFNLILLDIEMPDVSGFEFLHEIRKNPRYMTIPVIIVTGHPEKVVLEHTEHSSASGVLIKPVSSEILIELIDKVFSEPAANPFGL